MIIKEFQCENCKGIIEELVESNEQVMIECLECNLEMSPILSATPGYIPNTLNPVKISTKR